MLGAVTASDPAAQAAAAPRQEAESSGPVRTAAFFDLDKTVIAKSSTLAFSKPFFNQGLLNRQAVLKSTYAQFLFLMSGADHDQMDRMRSYLTNMCTGWDVEQVKSIVAETLHDIVDPLVFAEAANLIADHKLCGRDVVVVSADTAFTEKEENDPSACTVWGLWRDRRSMPRLMLMYGWADRLELNALLEKIELTCKRYHATTLLIEAKASGISVAQEIRRRNADATWATRTIDPKNKDKVARAYAVQGIFENGMVYTPDRVWADRVISQAATFPKGKHDDLVDTTTQAIGWMRDTGMLTIDAEVKAAIEEMKKHRSVEKPLYAA